MRSYSSFLLGACLLLGVAAGQVRAQTELPAEDCGDPVRPATLVTATAAPSITAADALYVLRTAVALVTCDLCTCDLDDSGVVTAGDALRTLKKAVGQDLELLCRLCGIPEGPILFTSNRTGKNQIWAVQTDGSGLVHVSQNAGTVGVNDEQANWSPDGERIVFGSDRTGDYEVFVMDADGANQTNLSNDPLDFNGQSCFSYDGSSIAYTDSDGSPTAEIFVMNSNGTNQSKLFAGPGYVDGDPEWSPDGARIVFETNRNVLDMHNQYDIYLMDADGSNQVNLTPGIAATDSDPAWSPDGTRIVFNSDRDGDAELYVVNANGSGLVQLTDNTAGDVHASFSPDGAFVSFVSDRDAANGFDVYIMRSTGGRAWRVHKDAAREFWTAWRPALLVE
ncbi:MAG: PD40 domain-containing protein [Deltaproteobacteria bacterium]|nr:PD40 domain-containing protein [Deltaproteobacteria bacterium]